MIIIELGGGYMKGRNWSSWLKLTEENLRMVPRAPGVYKIGYPGVKIPRFWQVDEGEDGRAILCIGQSSNVRERLRNFLKVIKGEGGIHMAGFIFSELCLERIFELEKIEFKFKEVESGEEAEEEEYKLLTDYQEIYGELPPLNRNKGKKPIYILYLDIKYDDNYYESFTIEARNSLDKLLEKLKDKEKAHEIKEFFMKIEKEGISEEKVKLKGKFIIWVFMSVTPFAFKRFFSSENIEEVLNILNLTPTEMEKIKRKIEWIENKPRKVREYLGLGKV